MIKLKQEEMFPAALLPQKKEEIAEINKDVAKMKIRISKCQRNQRRFKTEMNKQRDFLKILEAEITVLDNYISNL